MIFQHKRTQRCEDEWADLTGPLQSWSSRIYLPMKMSGFFFSSIKWCMMVWVYSPLSPPPLCIWLKSKIKSAEAMERKIFSGSDEVSLIQGKRRKRGSKKENSGLGGTSWSRLGKRVGGWGKRQMWLNYEGHHFALISRHKGYTSSLLLKRIYSS